MTQTGIEPEALALAKQSMDQTSITAGKVVRFAHILNESASNARIVHDDTIGKPEAEVALAWLGGREKAYLEAFRLFTEWFGPDLEGVDLADLFRTPFDEQEDRPTGLRRVQ